MARVEDGIGVATWYAAIDVVDDVVVRVEVGGERVRQAAADGTAAGGGRGGAGVPVEGQAERRRVAQADGVGGELDDTQFAVGDPDSLVIGDCFAGRVSEGWLVAGAVAEVARDHRGE